MRFCKILYLIGYQKQDKSELKVQLLFNKSTVTVQLQASATIQKLNFWPSDYHIKST